MARPLAIDRAIADRQLLGAALGDIEPWSRWIVVLKAAFALTLTDEELQRSSRWQVIVHRRQSECARPGASLVVGW